MGVLFDKPEVDIDKSKFAAQIEDFINNYREAGPNWANLLYGSIYPEIPGMFDRDVAFARELGPIGERILSGGLDRLGRKSFVPPRRNDERFEPILTELFSTAKSPVDDELTNYFFDKYRKGVSGRLAGRGLVGQGPGEGLQNEAEREWLMEARNRADARRLTATQAADALQGNLTARDLADLNARLGTEKFDIDEALREIGAGLSYKKASAGGQNEAIRQKLTDLNALGDSFFKFYGASIPLSKMLLDYDAQKKQAEATLTQSGEAPIDTFFRLATNLVGAFMGGGGGGVGQPSTPNVQYQPGGQQAQMSGFPNGPGFSFGAPGGGQGGAMTPWGTPVSGYSLYGAAGPAGAYAPAPYPTGDYNLSPGRIDYNDPDYRRTRGAGFIYG